MSCATLLLIMDTVMILSVGSMRNHDIIWLAELGPFI